MIFSYIYCYQLDCSKLHWWAVVQRNMHVSRFFTSVLLTALRCVLGVYYIAIINATLNHFNLSALAPFHIRSLWYSERTWLYRVNWRVFNTKLSWSDISFNLETIFVITFATLYAIELSHALRWVLYIAATDLRNQLLYVRTASPPQGVCNRVI